MAWPASPVTPSCPSSSSATAWRALRAVRPRSNATSSPNASWDFPDERRHGGIGCDQRSTCMTEQSVLVHREDDISVVTLNRPESLNSFDAAMTPALDAALSEADADPDTRAIIVTGAGRAFSAGGDVGTFGKNPDRRVNRRGWHLAQTMLRIEKPTVAMVNGAAVGLGLTVALLCDLAIAADSAKLGDTHVNLGLVAGDGAAVTLPLLIRPQKATE